MWQRLRSVVLEDGASQAVDNYSEQIPRFDEAWRALEWLLARSPDKGEFQLRDGLAYRLYVSDHDILAGTPQIWAVFSFDDNEVVIYDIKAVTDGQGDFAQSDTDIL